MDFFGYNKQVNGISSIATPSLVSVSIGDKLQLAQSCTVQYSRELQPVFELGSEDIWMTGGKSQGTCGIERAIGEGGVWEPYSGDACDGVDITITEGTSTCGAVPIALYCTGCLLRQVSFTANVGQLTVTDSADYIVGSANNYGG